MEPGPPPPEPQSSEPPPRSAPSTGQRLKRLLLGPSKDLQDPHLFRHISLVAFLAWVGLGADGLSSSAYGPQEAFKNLGEHTYLAVFLAFATAFTVLIISAAYSRVIEHFPFGGGGYVVASKLLGPRLGVVSGCALIIDYVLTITTSIAAGGEAVFSNFPPAVHWLKLPVAAVVLVVVAVFGFNAYHEGQLYVSTDNAQLTGQPVQVGSMNAGRLEAITPSIGAAVHKGDVIAQVALPSQTGMGQSGQPKLGFLGVGDTRVDVQAPVDGIVIAEPVAIGATVGAGQAIVSIVDPTQLWVNANIEETNIGRVKVGQTVIVHIDALGVDVPGRVEAVTPATSSTFSILPSSNASGNFTKVIQLVPVRISVNLGSQPLLLGANVEVKIRVAD